MGEEKPGVGNGRQKLIKSPQVATPEPGKGIAKEVASFLPMASGTGSSNPLKVEQKNDKDMAKGKRAGKPEPGDPATKEPELDNEVSGAECIAALGIIAPVSDDLKSLLAVTDKLYDVGRGEAMSYSSEPYRNAGAAAAHLFLGRGLPPNLPEYAIHMNSTVTNLFCTLVDMKRKIIVYADVRNIQSKDGSWERFESSLRDALAYANLLRRENREFNLVVSNQGIVETI